MTHSILTWNAIALEANRISHTESDKMQQLGPVLGSRALAIIHLAMYEAYSGAINDPT
jgi:vanadium chloroperoxidase